MALQSRSVRRAAITPYIALLDSDEDEDSLDLSPDDDDAIRPSSRSPQRKPLFSASSPELRKRPHHSSSCRHQTQMRLSMTTSNSPASPISSIPPAMSPTELAYLYPTAAGSRKSTRQPRERAAASSSSSYSSPASTSSRVSHSDAIPAKTASGWVTSAATHGRLRDPPASAGPSSATGRNESILRPHAGVSDKASISSSSTHTFAFPAASRQRARRNDSPSSSSSSSSSSGSDSEAHIRSRTSVLHRNLPSRAFGPSSSSVPRDQATSSHRPPSSLATITPNKTSRLAAGTHSSRERLLGTPTGEPSRRSGPLFSDPSSSSSEEEAVASRPDEERPRRRRARALDKAKWRELTRAPSDASVQTPAVFVVSPSAAASSNASTNGVGSVKTTASAPARYSSYASKGKGKARSSVSGSRSTSLRSEQDARPALLRPMAEPVSSTMDPSTSTRSSSSSESSEKDHVMLGSVSSTTTTESTSTVATTVSTSTSALSLAALAECAPEVEVVVVEGRAGSLIIAEPQLSENGALPHEIELAAAMYTSVFEPALDEVATMGPAPLSESVTDGSPAFPAPVPSASTSAVLRSSSAKLLHGTPLDITLSPLIEHIFALYGAEYERLEALREEEERMWRESLELAEQRNKEREAKATNGGWVGGVLGAFGWGGSQRSVEKTAIRPSLSRSNSSSKPSASPHTDARSTSTSHPPRRRTSRSPSKSRSPQHELHRRLVSKLGRKHPITIAYGYRARTSDVRHVFHSSSHSHYHHRSPHASKSSSILSFLLPRPSSSSSSSSVSSSSSSVLLPDESNPNVNMTWAERWARDDARDAELQRKLKARMRRREREREAKAGTEWEWVFASAVNGAFAWRSRGLVAGSRPRDTGRSEPANEVPSEASSDDEHIDYLSLGTDEVMDEEVDDEDGPPDVEVMEFEMDTFSITPSADDQNDFESHSSTRAERSASPQRQQRSRSPYPVAVVGSLPPRDSSASREFSSRNRKTKRAAVYRGRSASPLPRSPAWLGTANDRSSTSPTRTSSSDLKRTRPTIPRVPSSPSLSALTPSSKLSRHSRTPSIRSFSAGSGKHAGPPSPSSTSQSDPTPPPIQRKRAFYTDTRFFLVYALENSVRLRLLGLEGPQGDELRASGMLGWGGSRAVKMVRKERIRGHGAGATVRSLLSAEAWDVAGLDDDDEDEDEGEDVGSLW